MIAGFCCRLSQCCLFMMIITSLYGFGLLCEERNPLKGHIALKWKTHWDRPKKLVRSSQESQTKSLSGRWSPGVSCFFFPPTEPAHQTRFKMRQFFSRLTQTIMGNIIRDGTGKTVWWRNTPINPTLFTPIVFSRRTQANVSRVEHNNGQSASIAGVAGETSAKY